MHTFQLLLCLAVLCCVRADLRGGPEARSATPSAADKQSSTTGVLESVLRGNGKSRQSRCVRCYEDRYYGSSGSGGDRYGGYSSRAGEDPRSSWYYSYDRYDDRAGGGRDRDRDYDRYYSRDDRYTPRTYDRYEGRGYEDYYRRGSSSGYDRSPGAGYGSGYSGYSGYGYESRDRYYGDRYSDRDSSRDRYSDRSRTGYERYDPYDRYYSRYDFRNYRPWDETYRGQSGFDNSGRGYYFAGDDDDRRSVAQPVYDRERTSATPCGHLISNCPYGDRGGTKVSSSGIESDGYRSGHTSVMGEMGKPNGQGSWTYLGDQDKQTSRGGGAGNGSGAASNAGSGSSSSGSSISVGGGGRDRERDAQSSSYGGRPRPLGGSYLFDRDTNAVPESPKDGASSNDNSGGGGNGSANMPAAAAQTAVKPDESQDLNGQDKQKAMQ